MEVVTGFSRMVLNLVKRFFGEPANCPCLVILHPMTVKTMNFGVTTVIYFQTTSSHLVLPRHISVRQLLGSTLHRMSMDSWSSVPAVHGDTVLTKYLKTENFPLTVKIYYINMYRRKVFSFTTHTAQFTTDGPQSVSVCVLQ